MIKLGHLIQFCKRNVLIEKLCSNFDNLASNIFISDKTQTIESSDFLKSILERGLIKTSEKSHSNFHLQPSPLLFALIRKTKRAHFNFQNLPKSILSPKIYHQANFGLLTGSGVWVIHKNISANLCKPTDDVITIPAYDFHFKSEKAGVVRAEMWNLECLEIEKSF